MLDFVLNEITGRKTLAASKEPMTVIDADGRHTVARLDPSVELTDAGWRDIRYITAHGHRGTRQRNVYECPEETDGKVVPFDFDEFPTPRFLSSLPETV